MKKAEISAFARLTPLLLFCISFSVYAQKLPKVQTNSLIAPDNIRIDGRTNEWNDKYQAYNRHTDIYYTISNDNEKIYLVVKATNRAIAGKIISGGITFAINPSGKKKDKEQIAVTFPVYDENNKPDIDIINNPEITRNGSQDEINAAIGQANKKLIHSSKEIKLMGTKIITDTLISVYNNTGIRVAARFNKQGDYIYELAIPVKYLGLSTEKGTKFSYNVRLNEPVNAPSIVTASTISTAPTASSIVSSLSAAPSAPVAATDIDIFRTTDFWGAYTLAKK